MNTPADACLFAVLDFAGAEPFFFALALFAFLVVFFFVFMSAVLNGALALVKALLGRERARQEGREGEALLRAAEPHLAARRGGGGHEGIEG